MGKERLRPPVRAFLRNLPQYTEMDDKEFEKIFQEIVAGYTIEKSIEDIEDEIEVKMEEFKSDYDLSDMKINDKIVLRNLIQAIISLEDFEKLYIQLRGEVSDSNILLLDRVSGIMNKLRKDISDMQNDLKLTRKVRKESREDNFIDWLDDIKDRAQQFYKDKMLYIFCPECKMLLATVWLLYPDADNSLQLKCQREACGHEFSVQLSELYETGNQNTEDVIIP